MLERFDAFKTYWNDDLSVDYREQTHPVDTPHPNARGHEPAAETITSALHSRSAG